MKSLGRDTMKVTAEIRWFWGETLPPGFAEWFCSGSAHPHRVGDGVLRIDEYLREPQHELGLKRRGGKEGVEIKGLVAVAPEPLEEGPFSGPVEIWTKWTSQALDLYSDRAIAIMKRRWLRRFDNGGAEPRELSPDVIEAAEPGSGPLRCCHVELTQITLTSGEIWWTFGLEATGPLDSVETGLRQVAATLARRSPPRLERAVAASYPVWLRQLEEGLGSDER